MKTLQDISSGSRVGRKVKTELCLSQGFNVQKNRHEEVNVG